MMNSSSLLSHGVNGLKVQAGRPPPRHAPCWVTSIWQRLFPDKACSDVWVFGARWWKTGKSPRRTTGALFFPSSQSFSHLMGFPSPRRPDRRCQESDRSTNTGGTLGVGRWTVRQQDMGGEHLDLSVGGGGGGGGRGSVKKL